jgi:hypothetical protein
MDTKTNLNSREDEACQTVDAFNTETIQKRLRWRGALKAAPAFRFGLLAAGTACAGCALAILAGRAIRRRRERCRSGSPDAEAAVTGVTGVEGWKADLPEPLQALRPLGKFRPSRAEEGGRPRFFGLNRPHSEPARRPA